MTDNQTPTESQKFDAVMRKLLTVSKEEFKEAGKGVEEEARTSKEKAGSFLAPLATTLPSCGPRLGSLCSIRFASELSEGDALAKDLPHS